VGKAHVRKDNLMTAKELLLKQTREAFDGEMSLHDGLKGLTQEEASRRLNDTTWTIEEILFHVARCKIGYCRDAFGEWQGEIPKPLGDLTAVLELLDVAQAHLLECLVNCSEEALLQPLPINCHGESAAHFFWVMIQHDISHGAQIRALRRAYGTRNWMHYAIA